MAVVTVDPASRNVCDNMLVAPLLIAAGIVLSYFSENLWLIIISSMLVGSGLACSNAPSTQLVLRFFPKGMSTVSTSLDITFARLGGIATVALLAEAQCRPIDLPLEPRPRPLRTSRVQGVWRGT
jgi:hypothetical protein